MNERDNQESNKLQSMIENAPGTESLADLSLTDEQAEETQAGTGGGGGGAGKVSMRDFSFTMKVAKA